MGLTVTLAIYAGLEDKNLQRNFSSTEKKVQISHHF
jgi:hypothetical protein